MSFPTGLLKNPNIWVKCAAVEQVKELSEWAFNNGKHKPTVFVKEAHESYYYSVPKEVCTVYPPAPISTIIAFEDIEAAAPWKTGDLVTWPPMGEGVINQVSPSGNIHVGFDKGAVIFYEAPGDLKKQTNWATVKPGAAYEVWNSEGVGQSRHYFQFFAQGQPWFSSTPEPCGTVCTFKNHLPLVAK